MERVLRILLTLAATCALGSIPATAQVTAGSITGAVSDNTGAVMPGVTVTVTGERLMSPQMQVSDPTGHYRFDRLPPGTYDLKLELEGFKTAERKGINVSAMFTATVNVQLELGQVEESVTVLGVSPVVDTKSNVQQTVMSQDILERVPTGRDPWSLAKIIPGVTVSTYDVGGTQGMQQSGITAHGSTDDNKTFAIDGLSINWPGGGGGATMIYYDQGMFEEVNYQTSAIPAEVAVGGVYMNMVTKSGGSNWKGELRYYVANENLQAENFAAVSERFKFPGGNPVTKQHDFNGTGAGPILKNRIWFFGSLRDWRVDKKLLSVFNPDRTNAIDDNLIWNASGKISAQLSTNHAVAVAYNYNQKNRYHRRDTPPNFVEDRASYVQEQPGYSTQARYTAILGKSAVFESSIGLMSGTFPTRYQKDVTLTDIRREDVTLDTATVAAQKNYENPNYRFQFDNSVTRTASALGGNHTFKAGVQFTRQYYREISRVNGDVYYIFDNSLPVQVRAFNTPIDGTNYIHQQGFFGQDAWSIGRLTMNLGVRVDHAKGWYPDMSSPAGRWVPERRVARTDVYNQWIAVWRTGLVFDPFGNGKTAIKANASRYGDQVGIARVTSVNPFFSNTLSSANIAWHDLNGNLLPDDGELGAFEGFTGAATTHYGTANGPSWGYSDEITAGIEHEIYKGVRLGAMYYHRTNRNQLGSRNLAVPPTAYTPVSITNPLGGTLTLYNLARTYVGLQDNQIENIPLLDTDYNGLEITANKRFSDRWQMLFGFTAGKNEGGIATNRNDFNDPNNLVNQQGIVGTDATYQVKVSGTYVLPRIDVVVSGSALRNTGYPRQFAYSVNRTVYSGLVRSSQTVYVNRRGDERMPGVFMADLRFSRPIRLGGKRVIEPQVDLFNITNADTIVGIVDNIGPRLGYPTQILPPRIARFGFTFAF